MYCRRKDDEISGPRDCKEPIAFLQKAQVNHLLSLTS